MAVDEDRWFNDDEDVPVSTTPAFDGAVALVQDVLARPHDRAAHDRLDFALQAQAELWWKVACEEDEPDFIAECLRVVLIEMVRRTEALTAPPAIREHWDTNETPVRLTDPDRPDPLTFPSAFLTEPTALAADTTSNGDHHVPNP